MQRTRLNTLVTLISFKLQRLFSNPWRRISLILLGLLLGFFVGTAVSTTAGQAAIWDIAVAACLILFVEIVSIIVYRRKPQVINDNSDYLRQNPLYLDVLNSFKIGLIYGLFVEALKLGS